MSEDSGFIRNKPQKEEREYAQDLTPLSFGVDIHERIRNRMSVGEGFSATEGTENTEKIRQLSGLTPLHFVNEPQMKAPRVTPLEGIYTYACGHTWVRSREPAGFRHDERRCCCIGKKHEEAENQKNLSGLSVPLSLRGEFHKRGMI